MARPSKRDEVMAALATGGELSVAQVARAAGVTVSAAGHELRALVRGGEATRRWADEGRHVYRWGAHVGEESATMGLERVAGCGSV